MGCKLSISVVHPSKSLNVNKKKRKENMKPISIGNSPDADDESCDTIFIDSSPDSELDIYV